MRRTSSRSRSRSQRAGSEARQDDDSRAAGAPGRLTLDAHGAAASPPPGGHRGGRSVQTAPMASGATVASASTPKSAPPLGGHGGGAASPFPRTRCYRLDLERPFDLSKQASPMGSYGHRDYSGTVRESDLPPPNGPVHYDEGKHIALLETHALGRGSGSGEAGEASSPGQSSGLLRPGSRPRDDTSIAIQTARIFRGITVNSAGVITSMNARATRSQRRNKEEGKRRQGEKSRQAAKIEEAKDKIDEGVEAGMTDENDPTKVVSLYVMGEYEELNDLVRDGSKKLRDLKNHPEEHVYMHNRPRSSTASSAGILSPRSVSTNYSTHNDAVMGGVSSSSGGRKRGISQDKRYPYGATRTTPPKLKSNPRDTRPISHGGNSSGSGSNGAGGAPVNLPPSSRRMNSQASVVSHSTAGVQRGSAPCGVFADPRSAADGGGCMSTSPAAGSRGHPSSPGAGTYQVPQSNCSFFPAPHGSDERWGAFFGGWFNCGDHGGSAASRPHSPVQPGHYHATSPTSQGGAGGNGMYGAGGGAHRHHHGGHHADRGGHGYYAGQAPPPGPPAPGHGYPGRSPGYGYGPGAPYSEGRDPSQGFRGSGSVQRDRLVI